MAEALPDGWNTAATRPRVRMAAEEGSQEDGPVSIPWLDVICQRTASASWGGSWSERLEAYWYTERSAGALGPGRTGQPG
jgi:hypothetical protein